MRLPVARIVEWHYQGTSMNARALGTDTGSFWRQMTDGEHVCQIYSDEAGFLDSLTGFIGHGLWSGEAAVVIATGDHIVGLEQRLRASGLDLAHLRADDRFITLSPEATLRQFMDEGRPDPQRFDAVLSAVIQRARGEGRAVRAFGEMVVLLWNEGLFGATVQLEGLWQRLAQRERLQVLCSYPRRSFARGDEASRADIRAAHDRTLAI